MATAATPDDLFALGLHPDTIAAAQAQVSRVHHVGAGAGVVAVHESSAPLGVYQITVQVMGAGAPGTGTVRYTTDGGATWSATVTAPADLTPLVLATSGMAVTFDGALVVGDLYSFVAVRAVERHLSASNAKVRAKLRRRFRNDELPSWDDGLIAASTAEASLSLLTQRGYDPRNPGDAAVATRAKNGMLYVDEVGDCLAHPDGALAITADTAPEVFSDRRRED